MGGNPNEPESCECLCVDDLERLSLAKNDRADYAAKLEVGAKLEDGPDDIGCCLGLGQVEEDHVAGLGFEALELQGQALWLHGRILAPPLR